MNKIKISYEDTIRILEALEDAKLELEQLESQLEWYTSDRLLEKLEEAIEVLDVTMANRNE